jgi:RHS repeat-associated protein
MVKLFYNGSRLTLHLSAHGHCRRYFYMQSVPLAEWDCTLASITLLSTTESGTVIGRIGSAQSQAYTPYGWCLPRLSTSLAYNGEYLDEWPEGYHLGNGTRFYSPQRMRFSSPDPLSPFGKGGFNTYAYCKGDPCNYIDPDGLTPTPTSKPYFGSPPTLLALASEKVKQLGIINRAAKLNLVTTTARKMVEQSLPQIRDDNDSALHQLKPKLMFHSSPEKLFVENFMMPRQNELGVEKAHYAIAATLPKKSPPPIRRHETIDFEGYPVNVAISQPPPPLLSAWSLPGIRAKIVRGNTEAKTSKK